MACLSLPQYNHAEVFNYCYFHFKQKTYWGSTILLNHLAIEAFSPLLSEQL